MKYETLGKTGLKVSILGMGTGGHDPLGQKSGRPESEMHRLLHRAFDLGINVFDTSPGYLDSELILGRALKTLPREKLVVSTKIALVNMDRGYHIMTPEEIVESVESSLRRLQLTEVDVMLMAVPGPEYYDVVMNEHIPVFRKLKKQGKLRFIGSSELSRSDGSHEWLQKILPSDVLDVAMVAHNMLNQSAQHTVFPLCKEKNVGVLNIFTVRNLFWNPKRLREVIADLKSRNVLAADAMPDEGPLDWVLEKSGVDSLVEAAYRYAKHTEPVSTVMCGTLEINELEENVRNIRKGPLPAVILERLSRTFGHIAEAIGN